MGKQTKIARTKVDLGYSRQRYGTGGSGAEDKGSPGTGASLDVSWQFSARLLHGPRRTTSGPNDSAVAGNAPVPTGPGRKSKYKEDMITADPSQHDSSAKIPRSIASSYH